MSHQYNFPDSDELSKMSASWFVPFAYYNHIDKKHTAWQIASSASREIRIVFYNASVAKHRYFLQQIGKMDDDKLATNELALSAKNVKNMAKQLLAVV